MYIMAIRVTILASFSATSASFKIFYAYFRGSEWAKLILLLHAQVLRP